jgi:hypothetical protein
MPIRFRCAYCNQLMAIAKRKAGTVVRCPTCAGQVVVPSVESAAPEPANAGGPPRPDLFERSDFDNLFQNPAAPPQQPPPAFAPAPGPASPPAASGGFDVEPVPMSASLSRRSRPRGMVLTAGKAVFLFVLMVLLLAAAFVAGMFVGKPEGW